MSMPLVQTRRWTALLGIALIGLSLAYTGCGDSTDVSEDNPPPRSYQVRGIVRQISNPGAAKAQVWIHHEAIEDFVGIDGKIQPMKAMTMPFSVADTQSLSGLTPGTKIAFDLRVDWGAKEPGLITAIEALPDETALDFETAE